jgi:hypothetical protein
MMFGLREGSWWISSKEDPRWNASGHSDVGGFSIPPEAEKKIEALKKELGDPPDDLTWGYMKD